MAEILRQIFSLGLLPTENEKKTIDKIRGSYKSLRVVGRGTIVIDAEEIKDDLADNGLYDRARELVKKAS